jgi:hypothetical protein
MVQVMTKAKIERSDLLEVAAMRARWKEERAAGATGETFTRWRVRIEAEVLGADGPIRGSAISVSRNGVSALAQCSHGQRIGHPAQNAAHTINAFRAQRVRPHGQAAAMSAKVGMFQVKADDARVVPVKRPSAPKQVRPVQDQGSHSRSAQRARAIQVESAYPL